MWTLFATSFYEGEEGEFHLYVTVTEAFEQIPSALHLRRFRPRLRYCKKSLP